MYVSNTTDDYKDSSATNITDDYKNKFLSKCTINENIIDIIIPTFF